jgi:RimJ/RimL family protein N-acetyltransferase
MDLRSIVTKSVQKLFWIYLTDNFVIRGASDFHAVEPAIPCRLLAITDENCLRVTEFRDPSRIADYRTKLLRHEIGYFAECEGKVAGSIWATINSGRAPRVARGYMKLQPQEAMIHDIVAGDACRGKGVGPFMVGQFSSLLLRQYGVNRIVIDVNARNQPSLRMMAKAGVKKDQQVFYVSAFNTLLWHKTLKQYPPAN